MSRKPKRVIVIDGLYAAPESGTYGGVELSCISPGTLDQLLEAEQEWRSADLVVVLDGGWAFSLPRRKPEIDRLLYKLGLVDRARLEKLLAVPNFEDPDEDDDEISPFLYVQNTLAPDYGPHCFKREGGKLIWVGSENGGTDDPWEAVKRFQEAAARAVSRLFLSGHGAEQQEVWILLSVPEFLDRDEILGVLFGRSLLKSVPCDVMRDETGDDLGLLSLIEDLGLRGGSSLPDGLPEAQGPLGSAMGDGASWRRVFTRGGEQCGFEATARRLRTVWLDRSRARKSDSDIAALFLERLGVPSNAALAKASRMKLDECRTAKLRVESMLKGAANPMVGESEAMLQMYPKILEAARHARVPVLVYGETGSGKEALYDLLLALQDRDRKFEIRDLSSYRDANTISSAVFGHDKGSFTGADSERAGAIETAGGGTLVLDNLQNAPPEFFQAMLRVLEEKREYQRLGCDKVRRADCRIIAGFNVRPESLIEQHKLPEDWLMRFKIRIDIPPLRDRMEDVPLLIDAFVSGMLKKGGDAFAGLTREQLSPPAEVVDEWKRLRWEGKDGNVRGLKNAVEAWLRKTVTERTAGQQTKPAAGAGKSRGGRPRGSRDISDSGLAALLDQVAEAPSNWTISKLFDQIDVRCGGKKMKRTRGALLKRIERLFKDNAIEGAAQQRKKFKLLVESLRGFDELK